MEEKKKPGRPLSVIYADAKQAITRQVGNTMAAYGLPIFMAEGIRAECLLKSDQMLQTNLRTIQPDMKRN